MILLMLNPLMLSNFMICYLKYKLFNQFSYHRCDLCILSLQNIDPKNYSFRRDTSIIAYQKVGGIIGWKSIRCTYCYIYRHFIISHLWIGNNIKVSFNVTLLILYCVQFSHAINLKHEIRNSNMLIIRCFNLVYGR